MRLAKSFYDTVACGQAVVSLTQAFAQPQWGLHLVLESRELVEDLMLMPLTGIVMLFDHVGVNDNIMTKEPIAASIVGQSHSTAVSASALLLSLKGNQRSVAQLWNNSAIRSCARSSPKSLSARPRSACKLSVLDGVGS